jgi:hypothetical protein
MLDENAESIFAIVQPPTIAAERWGMSPKMAKFSELRDLELLSTFWKARSLMRNAGNVYSTLRGNKCCSPALPRCKALELEVNV